MVLLAEYTSLLFVATLLWLWVEPPEEPGKFPDRLAVARALAAAGLALGHVVDWLFPRPRPFQDHLVRLLIAPSRDLSFPSDHTLAAFAIAASLACARLRLSIALFSFGILIGLARVFVGTHYPGDVLVGAILGDTVGGLAHKADGRLAPVVRYADAAWHQLRARWRG